MVLIFIPVTFGLSDVTVKWYTFHVYILHLLHSGNEVTNAGIMLHGLFAQNATDVRVFHLSCHLKNKESCGVSGKALVSLIALYPSLMQRVLTWF
jgi:hypothetical protein